MTKTVVPVEDLPLPWPHAWGTIVALEYPADRPNVVELRFENGNRLTETRGALYELDAHGVWDLAQ